MNLRQQLLKPSLPFALLICAGVAAVFIYLRLYVFADRLVPLTYALALLLGVWHDNRVLHWSQVAFFCLLGFVNVYATSAALDDSMITPYGMMLINIITVGLVVDQLIVSREKLIGMNQELAHSNLRLEVSNQQLTVRDEEISSQNEELQQQAEELEQQTEELRQQAEELQYQAVEMQLLHDEAQNRGQVLESLLQISGTRSTDTSQQGGGNIPFDRLCAAAGGALQGEISVALVMRGPRGLEIRGEHDPAQLVSRVLADGTPGRALAELAIEQGRPACVEDLSLVAGGQVRTKGAVLAVPLGTGESGLAALALIAGTPRAWSEQDFRAGQWIAAQATLVSQSILLQAMLEDRKAQAEEHSRQKTRFLAAVSHDVRNPANAISLMAELIHRSGQDPKLLAEVPRLADGLRSNAKLLVELVSDVLDLTRFDSGKIDLEFSAFDVTDLIRAEVAQYQSLAQAAGLSLVAYGPPGDTLRLRTDRMKLARVLGNLIGNAVKFTEVGSVSVSCARHDGQVEIRVADTGLGIAREHLEHIYDEFYQIKNPERDRSKGTGLGLAICKRLVSAIGATMSVDSEVGRGTTFTLRIPANLIDEPTREPSEPQPEPLQLGERPLAGVRVLVVEDHESTRHAVSRLLAAQGATVDVAEDGRAALRHISHERHDVMLLDLMLPDMDGRELLRHLGQRRSTVKCVLAVSGDVTAARVAEVTALGADALVPKPIQVDNLIERIVRQLRAAVVN